MEFSLDMKDEILFEYEGWISLDIKDCGWNSLWI